MHPLFHAPASISTACTSAPRLLILFLILYFSGRPVVATTRLLLFRLLFSRAFYCDGCLSWQNDDLASGFFYLLDG